MTLEETQDAAQVLASSVEDARTDADTLEVFGVLDATQRKLLGKAMTWVRRAAMCLAQLADDLDQTEVDV